jgi:hypothetical protein
MTDRLRGFYEELVAAEVEVGKAQRAGGGG